MCIAFKPRDQPRVYSTVARWSGHHSRNSWSCSRTVSRSSWRYLQELKTRIKCSLQLSSIRGSWPWRSNRSTRSRVALASGYLLEARKVSKPHPAIPTRRRPSATSKLLSFSTDIDSWVREARKCLQITPASRWLRHCATKTLRHLKPSWFIHRHTVVGLVVTLKETVWRENSYRWKCHARLPSKNSIEQTRSTSQKHLSLRLVKSRIIRLQMMLCKPFKIKIQSATCDQMMARYSKWIHVIVIQVSMVVWLLLLRTPAWAQIAHCQSTTWLL